MRSTLQKTGKPLAELYRGKAVAVHKTARYEAIEYVAYYPYSDDYEIRCIGKTLEDDVPFRVSVFPNTGAGSYSSPSSRMTGGFTMT